MTIDQQRHAHRAARTGRSVQLERQPSQSLGWRDLDGSVAAEQPSEPVDVGAITVDDCQYVVVEADRHTPACWTSHQPGRALVSGVLIDLQAAERHQDPGKAAPWAEGEPHAFDDGRGSAARAYVEGHPVTVTGDRPDKQDARKAAGMRSVIRDDEPSEDLALAALESVSLQGEVSRRASGKSPPGALKARRSSDRRGLRSRRGVIGGRRRYT